MGGKFVNVDLCFEKLIKGQLKYQSANLGLNLLISRLQKKYAANQAPVELDSYLQEMKAFFQKYTSILVKDVEALKKM